MKNTSDANFFIHTLPKITQILYSNGIVSLLNQEHILEKVGLQDSINIDYQGKKNSISMKCLNSKHKKA